MEDFMTVPEAAVALGLSESAVRNRLKKGYLRGEKLGPMWLVPKSEVERWLRHPRMRAPKAPKP
jgi:excisionase family DNA binding protein